MMSSKAFDSAERILYYVLQKQTEYVQFQKDHPFLEQTVMNLALYYRSTQQLQLSLNMWKYLMDIQVKLYGEKEMLIYTYKNIGVCLLGLGKPEEAEVEYQKALKLQELSIGSSPLQASDAELTPSQRDDLSQMGQIYFNLYLSAITNGKKGDALDYNDKNMRFNK